MDNRPYDAKESQTQFLMSENNPESGTPQVPVNDVQTESAADPVAPATAPQPTQPPADEKPLPLTSARPVQATRPKLIIPGQEPAPVQPIPAAPAQSITAAAQAPPIDTIPQQTTVQQTSAPQIQTATIPAAQPAPV
ncbi:MAG: hypothetical protein ABF381_14420, partial [Akkermansiaceae bacterium]